jgi:hypothetical protein
MTEVCEMFSLRTTGIQACCLLLLTAATVSAQHRHRSGHTDLIPHNGHLDAVHHHGRHFGHSNWNYVVPHHSSHHHHGSYYVQGNGYYYTPTPVVRVTSSFQSAQLPVQVVQQPVQMQYGGYVRYEDLSGRLETEVNRLCLDMFYNYRHNPGFDQTYREAYALLEACRFVHSKEHQGDRNAIRDQVVQMDQLMHHVQGVVQQWSRLHVRQVASGGVIEKSSAVEAILHHLCYDVGIEPHGDDEPAPAPMAADELAPAPGAVISSPPPSF